ncbi:hypothetical protein EYC80_007546 [Monilinia laxa]|uniref:Uncharacterized protein n=1 Tax=Monilinia laxa TaxID=61186 RepID=A0A5N6JWA5_MONLA|nr:hypothetical protein EYC80_007546 [Monilinia laxa]
MYICLGLANYFETKTGGDLKRSRAPVNSFKSLLPRRKKAAQSAGFHHPHETVSTSESKKHYYNRYVAVNLDEPKLVASFPSR